MTKRAVAGFVLALTGCFSHPSGQAATNDGQAMSTGQFAVESQSQLPECDEATEAYTAYVRDEAEVVKCTAGTWTSNES